MNIETDNRSFDGALRHWERWREPCLLLDHANHRFLWANAAGLAFLGHDSLESLQSAAPDGAMPALAELKTLHRNTVDGTTHRLTALFWTPAGARRLHADCRVVNLGPYPRAFLVLGMSRARETQISVASDAALGPAWGEDWAVGAGGGHQVPSSRAADSEGAPRTDDTRVDTLGATTSPSSLIVGPDVMALISHELRTPLSAIMGFAEIMKDQGLGPIGTAKYLGYARDIYDSAQHALSLVDDLRDLAALEAGAIRPSPTAVDVEAELAACAALLQPIASRARVTLTAVGGAPLPGLLTDRRHLKQIVLNILTNALKCTKPGGAVWATASFEPDGPLTIRVQDTGIGMTPEDVALAFVPWGQCGDAKRREERLGVSGSGLGLPLTKALAEANGASVALHSVTGAGTVVLIAFPKSRQIPPSGQRS